MESISDCKIRKQILRNVSVYGTKGLHTHFARYTSSGDDERNQLVGMTSVSGVTTPGISNHSSSSGSCAILLGNGRLTFTE
jgi:hypothetical protein